MYFVLCCVMDIDGLGGKYIDILVDVGIVCGVVDLYWL